MCWEGEGVQECGWPWRTEAVESLELEQQVTVVAQCRCWEPKLEPLKETYMLLIPELCLWH